MKIVDYVPYCEDTPGATYTVEVAGETYTVERWCTNNASGQEHYDSDGESTQDLDELWDELGVLIEAFDERLGAALAKRRVRELEAEAIAEAVTGA